MCAKGVLTLVCAAGGMAVWPAAGAPREQVTFTAVPSAHALNNAGNTTLTATFNGADAGGPYEARRLLFSGQWTRNGANPSDPYTSVILVTPPGGTPFLVTPAPQETSGSDPLTVAVPAGAFGAPVSPVTTAGVWSFQFFQTSDWPSTDPDATWDTLTVTLDDEAAAVAPLSGGVVVSLPDAVIDNHPPVSYTINLPAGTTVNRVRARALITATTGQAINNVVFHVAPPAPGGGPRGFTFSGVGSSRFDEGVVGLAAEVDSGAGPWTVWLTPSSSDPGQDGLAHLSIVFDQAPPPPAVELTLVDGSFVSANVALAPAEIKWVTFDVPVAIDAALGSYLDIDAVGSVLTPSPFVSLGLYNSAGSRLRYDGTEDGTWQGEMSFGDGNRDGGLARIAFTGRDGALPAGRYYLAVSGSGQLLGSGAPFTPQANGAFASGNAVIRVRYGAHHSALPPGAFTDWGVVGVGQSRTHALTTTPYQVKWYRFEVPDFYSPATNRALEIDMVGSVSSQRSLAVYSAAGGPPLARTSTSFGFEALASFGPDNRPVGAGPQTFTGQDGSLAPGVYYIGVKMGPASLFLDDIVAENLATETGDFVVNLRTIDASLDTSGNTPPAAEDVTLAPGTTARSAVVSAAAPVKWYRFALPGHAADDGNSAAAGPYLDIDTSATSGVVTATDIGVYSAGGLRVGSDSLDGAGSYASMSFGDAAPQRASPGFGGVGGNGRDGPLPAGTYYAAVLGAAASFPATTFNVTASASAQSGTVTTTFATNITAPAACGPADMGGTGGVPGGDHALDNNDFVVFIDYFFGQNPLADVGRQGGVAPGEGLFDNNDFVVFIDYFFAGCP
ncbi:MAG TPA: GC-type dockerin domain-anchored protein [Phycisphaerales bacterium]|nr:GC-type dockerin domain-anchored protein [Phycisphaerales bacterium]